MILAIAQQMLNGVAALNSSVATPRAFRHSGIVDSTHNIKWGVGVSSGEVTIETADKEDDTDGWATYAVVPFTNRTTLPYTDTVRVPGNFRAFRHRVSAIVTDGTVTSTINGAA